VPDGAAWQRLGIELAPGEKRVVQIGDREILVCRTAERYFALASRCTHAAWPLADEPVEGAQILCTLHGARFDMRDGCPLSGPARKPLSTYPIELRDGELYVSL
jgi:3-phenylpropionate/trans-cinnamate dioxygenase ferredoxin subunit